jgi:hypothetical protein
MVLPPPGYVPEPYIKLKAKNPHTGVGEIDVFVSRAMLEDLEESGPDERFFDALLLPEALESPSIIMKGLKRPGFDDGFCFIRKPSIRWINSETTTPPPVDMVFLAFIRSEKEAEPNRFIVHDWTMRRIDKRKPELPEDWENDFEKRVFP